MFSFANPLVSSPLIGSVGLQTRPVGFVRVFMGSSLHVTMNVRSHADLWVVIPSLGCAVGYFKQTP